MQEYGTLIRTEEAMRLLARYEDNLVMSQLLNYANYVVIGRFQSEAREELPVADFDLFFYLTAVERFCQEQGILRSALAKEDVSIFGDELEQVRRIMHRLEQTTEFVRWQEAMHLLDSVEEPTTMDLMLLATYLARHPGRYDQPTAPFDCYFFMRAMETFCGDHLFLTKVLNGEDLRWFSVASPPEMSPSL